MSELKCLKCGATGELSKGFRRHGIKILSAFRKVQQYQCVKCGHVFHEELKEKEK